ncbi:hypothetical protein NKH18_42805 [Streptomyces sp. M10(2022)]
MPGLAAAGAVRSSARDMLGCLTALLEPDRAPNPSLRTALAEVQRPRLTLPRTGSRLCLIWNLRPRRDGRCSTTPEAPAASPSSRASGPAPARRSSPSPTPPHTARPFIQAAYGALCELDTAPSCTVWTARV